MTDKSRNLQEIDNEIFDGIHYLRNNHGAYDNDVDVISQTEQVETLPKPWNL